MKNIGAVIRRSVAPRGARVMSRRPLRLRPPPAAVCGLPPGRRLNIGRSNKHARTHTTIELLVAGRSPRLQGPHSWKGPDDGLVMVVEEFEFKNSHKFSILIWIMMKFDCDFVEMYDFYWCFKIQRKYLLFNISCLKNRINDSA